ncbi:MAG: DUF819 family protein [bacterium]|jgi:uncharacterized membrane protein
MGNALITSPAGVLAVLAGVTSLFFFLEKKTGLKLFNYFPPLIFIYLVPVLLSNTGVIPNNSPVYSFMRQSVLPMFLVLMLLNVDFLATVRAMGRGVIVMLLGTLGVVVGAPIALFLVRHGLRSLGPDAWKGYGALAGSWIGGTGNMAATAVALGLDDKSLAFGYGLLSDNAVYLVWLPLLLMSKNFAGWFHRFTGVPDGHVESVREAAGKIKVDSTAPGMVDYLYLAFIGFGVTAISAWLAGYLPEIPRGPEATPFITTGTWNILIVTLFGIMLSLTRVSRIPGSHALSMALVYLFVARMGAIADLSRLDSSILWFLLGAYIWIFIHGFFLVGAARLFKVDVHTTAIASAANIGGAASAPIVAAHHNPVLVPVAILMALIGYAIGNPAAIFTGLLCKWVW